MTAAVAQFTPGWLATAHTVLTGNYWRQNCIVLLRFIYMMEQISIKCFHFQTSQQIQQARGKQAKCPNPKLMRKTSNPFVVCVDAKGNFKMFQKHLPRRLSGFFSQLTTGTEEFTRLQSVIAAGRPARRQRRIQSRRVTEFQISLTTRPSDPPDPPPELTKTPAVNALSVPLGVWA